MATIVLGAQWGDEGKGKLTDILASKVKLCTRAQGGNNAGHSVKSGGVTYDFHLLPSGLTNPECINLIGSGVVANIRQMFEELDALEAKGLHGADQRVFISDRAHVVFDLHQKVDGLEEAALGGKKVGTTGKGIGPTYSTKASRSGVRISEVFDEKLFEFKLRNMAAMYQRTFGDLLKYDVEDEINRFKSYRVRLAPMVCDAVSLIQSAEESNTKFLVEGANAIMLDIDHGTYPYVTSSNTGLGGIFTGLAINPRKIDSIIGVVKAYTTRVGSGPFPSEDLGPDGKPGEVGKLLQSVGHEVGVTTGRARRCGHLDLVVVKYSNTINHYDSINLTKLDVLDTLPTLKVAIAYKDPVTKAPLDSLPADLSLLANVEIEYKEFPGWQKPTTGAKSYYDLPKAARDYVEFIEKFVGVHIGYIGIGPSREDMITR